MGRRSLTHVYLLHFEPRFRHAGHYIGVTHRDDVLDRVGEHQRGEGAVLTRHARRAGCALILARVWENVPRRTEMRLKGRGLAPLCPICRQEERDAQAEQDRVSPAACRDDGRQHKILKHRQEASI